MHKLFAYIEKYHHQILIASTILSFFYFLWGVNSWQYSYVGDVWAFYTFAKNLVLHNFQGNPFSSSGVWENGALGSYYQAIFLNVFGISNFAWRLSNIILIIPISYFFYKWIGITFDWKIAMLSTVLLQFSYYISTFFKIGYINPQALFLFVLALYLAALSAIKPTKRNGLFLGLVLGISFYIYLGPIYPLIIWPYLLPLFTLLKSKHKKQRQTGIYYFLMLIIGYSIFISFIFSTNFSLEGPLSKTGLHNESGSQRQLLTNIGNNFLVFYHEFPILFTHFLPFPYLDRVTQIFALIGTLTTLGFVYIKKYRYLMLTYLSTCVLLGLTNPYSVPSTSRGMFFLVFGFIFAAIGLRLITKISSVKQWVILPILLLIGILNVYVGHYAAFAKIDYTSMALIVKNLQQTHNEPNKKIVLVISDSLPIMRYIYELPDIQEAYGLQDVQFETMNPSVLNCGLLQNKKVLVFSYDTFATKQLNNRNCSGKVQALTTSQTSY